MRTTDTWTTQVHSLDELPAAFRQLVPASGSFPYTLYSPEISAKWATAGGRVTCLYEDRISLLESRNDGGVIVQTFMLADIQHVEYGCTLMHSWIRLFGTISGSPTTGSIDFNTVVGHLFFPIIERFRLTHAGVQAPKADAASQDQRKELEFLGAKNFKFRSYATNHIPHNAVVRAAVFQPELKETVLTFFSRVRVPAQLAVLTDRELVLIQDEAPEPFLFQVRTAYGAVCTFLPLKEIKGAEIATDPAKGDLTLRISIGYQTVAWTFESSRKAELDAFIAKIKA